MRDSKSLFEAACRRIPGGVNSPVRAFRGVGGDPFFVAHEPLQAAVRGLELVQQTSNVDGGDLDAVSVVRGATERGRNVDRHGHS